MVAVPSLVRCLGQSIAELGIGDLVRMIPGGEYALKVAKLAWGKYRKLKNDQQIRDDVAVLARQSFDEAKQAAEAVAREVAQHASQDERVKLELVLTQVPVAVRQTLKRPADPSGRTVSADFKLTSEDDIVPLFSRPPRFAPNDELPGRPGWRLVRQLGIGGFGEVWLVVNNVADHLRYAVKFGRDADADRDLVNEKDVIIRLMKAKPHPSLVKLLDVSFTDGTVPWLAYEYVAGGDLTDLIHEIQALPPEQRVPRATAVFRELVEAVAELHKQAIVHRDLKPSNILKEEGTHRLRVTDFGISGLSAKKDLRDDMAGTTTRAGRMMSGLRGSHTALYASPQQKDPKNPPDSRDDVHALGVIGYQLFTGHLTQGAGPDMDQDLAEAGVGDELRELVKQCVAQKADRRPADAGAVLARLPAGEAVPLTFAPIPIPTPTAAKPTAPRVIVAEQVPPSVLPPLPKEILELEGRVASLELTIGELEKGTHPDMATSARALQARGMPIETIIARLKPEIDANPNRSAADLCKLFPDTPTTILLPVISGLQRRLELASTLAVELRRLKELQTADFHQILEKSLAPAPRKAFPIREWHAISEHVEVRRYRFASGGLELLKLAEEFFRSRQEEEDLHARLRETKDVGMMEQYLTRFPKGTYSEDLKRKRDSIRQQQQEAQAEEAARQRKEQDRKSAEEAEVWRAAVLKKPRDKEARRQYLRSRTNEQKALDGNTLAWQSIYWVLLVCLIIPIVIATGLAIAQTPQTAASHRTNDPVFYSVLILSGLLSSIPLLFMFRGELDLRETDIVPVVFPLVVSIIECIVFGQTPLRNDVGQAIVWITCLTPLVTMVGGFVVGRLLDDSSDRVAFASGFEEPGLDVILTISFVLFGILGASQAVSFGLNWNILVVAAVLIPCGVAFTLLLLRVGIGKLAEEYGPLPFWQSAKSKMIKEHYR